MVLMRFTSWFKKSERLYATLVKVLLIVVLSFSSWKVSAQNHTTMGTDFWVSYLYFSYANYAPQYQVTLFAFASGPRSCTVTVSNSDLLDPWSSSFNVTPGNVTQVSIPYSLGCTPTSGVVTQKAFHVTSTDTISLYLVNLGHNSLDITNALPTESLRSDYMVQAYQSKLSTDYRSEVVVVATEDSTEVDIHVTAPTLNGFAAGSTHTINLNRGDTYQLRGTSSGEGDLSGTTINARDCKKIAVYSGHFCAYVPSNAISCDHIFDQSMPTSYWGKEFLVTSTCSQFDDHVKVMALNNNCQVMKNGVLWQTLNAGQSAEFTLGSSNPYALIETSEPASVYLFMGSAGDYNGDPTMVVINPVEQQVKNITFATYSTQFTNTHFVNIIADAGEMQHVRLDGNPVSSTLCFDQYRVARVSLNQGAHTISSTGGSGFTAYAYGIGSHESYGYSVGSSLNYVPTGSLYVDGRQIADGSTLHFCEGRHSFSIQSDGGIATTSWTINGEDVGIHNTLILDTVPGVFHIVGTATTDSTNGCSGGAYVFELGVTVEVHPKYEVHVYDTIVVGELPWHYAGRVYTDSVTDDVIRFQTTFGCDSIILYSLCVIDDTVREYFYDTICVGELYNLHGFDIGVDTANEVGTYLYRWSDTTYVALLYLTRMDRPTIQIDVEIAGDSSYYLAANSDGDVFRWSSNPYDASLNGQEDHRNIIVCPSVPTTYYLEVWNSDFSDCWSSDSIMLVKRTGKRDETLWVPNVFTPDRFDNNLFKAVGVGIAEYEISIYHRWGELIFHSHDMNEGWDGTFKGAKCPSGAYVYLILYRSIYAPKELQRLFGTVLLLR